MPSEDKTIVPMLRRGVIAGKNKHLLNIFIDSLLCSRCCARLSAHHKDKDVQFPLLRAQIQKERYDTKHHPPGCEFKGGRTVLFVFASK